MENQYDREKIGDALVPLEGEQESAEGDAQHPQQILSPPVPRGPLPKTVPPEHTDHIESMFRHEWSFVIELEDTAHQQHIAQQAIDSDYTAFVYAKKDHTPYQNTYTMMGEVFLHMVNEWNNCAKKGQKINKSMLLDCFFMLEPVQSRIINDSHGNPVRSTNGKLLHLVDTPGCLLRKTIQELAVALSNSVRYVKKQRRLWIESGIANGDGNGWILFVAGPWRGNQRIMYAYADQQPSKLAPLPLHANTSERVMHQAVEDANTRAATQERKRNNAEKRHKHELRKKDDEYAEKLKKKEQEIERLHQLLEQAEVPDTETTKTWSRKGLANG